MRVYVRWGLAFAAVAAVAAGLWLALGGLGRDSNIVAVNGRIEAITVYVATKVAGKVTEMRVREGDRVGPGDLLAQIDIVSLTAQRDQAMAQADQARRTHEAAAAEIDRAKSQLKWAQQEARRTEELVKNGYATRQLLDQRLADLRAAQAGLAAANAQDAQAAAAIQAAEAAVRSIDSMIADSSIHSPAAGQVLYRLAEPGEVLPAGGRVAAITDQGDIYLTLFLPETVAGHIAVGDEARIRLDARPDELIPAVVTFISPQAQFTPRQVETRDERQKLTFRAKLSIPQQSLKPWIKPGMPGMGYVRLDASQPWPAKLP